MMKKLLFGALVFASSSLMAQVITNGDFEGGTSTSGAPTGWLSLNGIVLPSNVGTTTGNGSATAVEITYDTVRGTGVVPSYPLGQLDTTGFVLQDLTNVDVSTSAMLSFSYMTDTTATTMSDDASVVLAFLDNGSQLTVRLPLPDASTWTATGNIPVSVFADVATQNSFPTDSIVAILFYASVSEPAGAKIGSFGRKMMVDDVVITSQSAGTIDLDLANGVTVYPNPTTEVINFNTTLNEGSIELYDINGKLVDVKNINSSITSFNVSSLEAGNYLYRIFNANRELVKADKFMVK